MNYTKPALSVDEQIALLQRRGMAFNSPATARDTLRHTNYYRLRAYWLPFEVAGADRDEHTFRPGTSFESVLDFYTFDQRLKLLLMDAIERVEVSLRTRWANELALRYGSHAYLDAGLFADTTRHSKCLQTLREEVSRSQETFIKHYRNTYTNPALPPLWAACEVMTLGQLSQWMDNLKTRQDRQAIAQAYGFDEVILCAFAHHLATVRNLCAHHSRVWNRKFTIKMKLPARPKQVAMWFSIIEDRKLYNTLLMLALMLESICPGSTWRQRLVNLIDAMPPATPFAMGFPQEWRSVPIWSWDSGAVV